MTVNWAVSRVILACWFLCGLTSVMSVSVKKNKKLRYHEEHRASVVL